MPSVVHRLGELEHIYDRHNLKLKTHGYIALSSTQCSSCPFYSDFQNLDALISSGTWTAGANRLWLQFELLFDDVSVPGTSTCQITEEIGVALCNAELWSQLCLDASLTINDSNNLYISLSTQSLSNSNVRPPRSMPSTCIETISLSFHFATCRRIRNALRAPVTVSASGVSHTLTSTKPTDDQFDYGYGSSLSLSEGYRDTLMDKGRLLNFAALLDNTSPISSQDSVFSAAQDASSLNAPMISYSHATQDVTLDALVQMVDSSFRRMMCDKRPGRLGGIVLSSDVGHPKLAAISPELFSPGYVKAVSQRAELLPTIARTLTRIYRRTSSSGLRTKFERLQQVRNSADSNCDATMDSDANCNALLSSVEVRLWFLTRSKLIDCLACKNLKSFSISNRMISGSHELPDETLDGVGDEMLDEEQASTSDSYDDLNTAYHFDLFQEHSLDGITNEAADSPDGDLF